MGYLKKDDIDIYTFHWLFKISFMKGYAGITLTPKLMLFRRHYTHRLLLHEMKHVEQMKREIWFPIFWIKYVGWYLWGLIKYRNHWLAYDNIPYEIEAREAENA